MALPPAKRGDYVQLIEFIRPESDLSGLRERSSELSHNSDLVKQTALSGHDARSFYEELVTLSDLIPSSRVKKSSGKAHQAEGNQHTYEHSTLKQLSHGRRKSERIKDVKFPASVMAQTSRNRSLHTMCAVKVHKFAKPKAEMEGRQRAQNKPRTLVHKEAELLRCAQNGELEVLQNLIASGIDVNASDMFGWTAAMCAAFEGHVEVLKSLASAGADLSLTNSSGQTALMLAQCRHHTSVGHFIERIQNRKIDDMCKVHDTTPVAMNKSHYCDVCQMQYTDEKFHSTSTVHLFNMGLKPRDNTFLIPPSNVGYRMLVRSGWDDNKGLGPEGQGLKYPVKTYLKMDRKGLGNSKNEKAKITHFQPHDRSAVDVCGVQQNSLRKLNIKTLARKAQRRKESRDRLWEINMRRALS